MKFKEKWNQKDERCPTCGSVTKASKGLTKDNVRKLFSFKASFGDWITLFIIMMMLFMAWSYNNETKSCRYVINNLEDICIQYNVNPVVPKPNVPALFVGDLNDANEINNPEASDVKNELP